MKGKWVFWQLILTFVVFIPLGAVLHAWNHVNFWGMLVIMCLPSLCVFGYRLINRAQSS